MTVGANIFHRIIFFFLLHLEKEDMLRKIKSDKQKTKGISY